MSRDDVNNHSDERSQGADASAAGDRQRHGDGWIVLFFVIGLAALIIGFASSFVAAEVAGGVLVALGVVLLLRPAPAKDGATAAAWECSSCGWVFEMQTKRRRSQIKCTCPHCKKQTTCRLLRQGK